MAKKRKLEWNVVDGKVVRTVPAVKAQVVEVPTQRLNAILVRATRQKERAANRLKEAQEKFDDAVEEETKLTDLIAQVNGEPVVESID